MKNNNIELLAPAGNMESVYSALNGGANAIYLGGKSFSARSSANNFSIEEIAEVVKIATLRDVEIFLTVNTLYKDDELEELVSFLDKVYEVGVTAFIIQDIGMATLIKNRYPKIKLHGSTQLSAHSLEDVKLLESFGFDRIVLARETSLAEMEIISSNTDVELEVFIHGALCVSYSGQCLMSSLLGGRSGNRGKCAQPCRMTYDLYDANKNEPVYRGYLLSPQDINSLNNVDKLIKAGVTSLKIEGRMKSPEYVYATTSSYREKIDNLNADTQELKKTLLGVFNRGGTLSDGYLKAYSGPTLMSNITPKNSGTFLGYVTDFNKVSGKCVIKLEDDVVAGDGLEIWTRVKPHVGCGISKELKKGDNLLVNIKGEIKVGDKVYKSHNKKLIDSLSPKHKKLTRKSNINCSVDAKIGMPFKFTFIKDDIIIEKIGDVVEKATNKSLSKDDIIGKISKTGATPFNVIFDNINIDDDIFLNLSSINALRREATDELENKIIKSIPRKINDYKYNYDRNTDKNINLSVLIYDMEHLEQVLKCNVKRVYIPISDNLVENIEPILNKCKEKLVELFISLPSITHTDDEIILQESIDKLNKSDIDGYLVSNYGQIAMANKKVILDYNFNITNNYSRDSLLSLSNVKSVTLSPELNLKELKQVITKECEVIIHGRQPVMETRQCPVGLYVSTKDTGKFCSKKNKNNNYFLRDRKECDFPIVTNCNICNATIFNSQTLFMLDKYDDLKNLNGTLRINVSSDENPYAIVKAYENAILNDKYDNMFDLKDKYEQKITKGHFYRGVL